MSHISKIELEVKDIAILGQACTRLGLELLKKQEELSVVRKRSCK